MEPKPLTTDMGHRLAHTRGANPNLKGLKQFLRILPELLGQAISDEAAQGLPNGNPGS